VLKAEHRTACDYGDWVLFIVSVLC